MKNEEGKIARRVFLLNRDPPKKTGNSAPLFITWNNLKLGLGSHPGKSGWRDEEKKTEQEVEIGRQNWMFSLFLGTCSNNLPRKKTTAVQTTKSHPLTCKVRAGWRRREIKAIV